MGAPSRLQMTAAGKKHFGGCVAQFYSPAVQQYLMQLPGGEAHKYDPVAALVPASAVSDVSSTKRSASIQPTKQVVDSVTTLSTHVEGVNEKAKVMMAKHGTDLIFPDLFKPDGDVPAKDVNASMVQLTLVGGGEELRVDAPLGTSILDI